MTAASCTLVLTSAPLEAKRSAPAVVEPVAVNGVIYAAPATAMGFVVASDASSHRELWRQQIYTVRLKPTLERDVQDVFITSLTLRGGSLIITNERGERFALDLSTRRVAHEGGHHE